MPDKPSRPNLHSPNPSPTDPPATNPEVRKPRTRTLRSDIVFTFALGIGLAIAYQLRHEVALLYVSALFAVVLMPVIRGVQKIKIGKWSPGRGSAIAIILLVLGGAITLFALFALPPVIQDMQKFVKELPTRGPEMLSRLKHLPFASRLDVAALSTRLQDFASNFVTYLVTSLSTWATGVFNLLAGIILTIYFLLEGEHAYHWVLSFVSPLRRERLNQTLLRADVRMGRWLLGQGALMLILGIYSTVVFSLLHVRYAYALGVITGVFNIIPIMGALISMALAVVAAAMDSWMRVVYVLIAFGIYGQVENSYLTPRIMKSSVDLPGLAIIVSLLLGSAIDGVRGALVSVPTAVLVAVILDEYAVQRDKP